MESKLILNYVKKCTGGVIFQWYNENDEDFGMMEFEADNHEIYDFIKDNELNEREGFTDLGFGKFTQKSSFIDEDEYLSDNFDTVTDDFFNSFSYNYLIVNSREVK